MRYIAGMGAFFLAHVGYARFMQMVPSKFDERRPQLPKYLIDDAKTATCTYYIYIVGILATYLPTHIGRHVFRMGLTQLIGGAAFACNIR